ncbi:MAG: FAD-dependent oxidoreductase [Bryobacteraceae bacterium]
MDATPLPAHARVVIIGAGIVGSSAAYHLTKFGWRDVVVVDQGPLVEVLGSTSHAPGLMFQTNPSKTVCALAQWTVELYRGLEDDGEPCFYPVGSLEVACTPERHQELKRRLGFAKAWGLDAAILSPAETRQLVPIMDVSRISSAYYVPSDGNAKGVRLLRALAREASAAGVRFFAHAPVTGIEKKNGRVHAVVTQRGRIETEQVLLCAGIWGPRIGRMAGVPVPMLPLEHCYVRTGPIADLAGETRELVHPVVRHQDRAMYFRQHRDAYGIGSYRHEPMPVPAGELADTARSALRPFTPQHFAEGHAAAIELFPCLAGVDLPCQINGIFAFTPDGNSLVGKSAYLEGFWLAEAVWVTHGGGVGRAIAEYMDQGLPSLDLHDVDCNRFHRHASSGPFVWRRGIQQYRWVYDIIHPLQQMEEPRPLRVSPFHRRQQELGAVFFESAGWERPQWYASNAGLAEAATPARDAWTALNWSPVIAQEHRAARAGVALFDLTPFTKLEISGPNALAFLQHLAANQMDQPVGRITYTPLLNQRGGIECDLTITRLGPQRFLVVTGGAVGMHDLAWIREHLPRDGSAHLHDITSAECVIGVWGPRARDLMRAASEDDFSNAAFPYMTAREVSIGHAPATALRISYVGELGWEVYTPTEYGLYVWDSLWKAGQQFGAIAAGGGAFDSLRLEKGYRLWGADIHGEYNPFEAGLSFAVKPDKGDFLGRQALEGFRREGLRRKLCCLTLDDPAAVVMGKEPVLSGHRTVGFVTSAGYGYTVGRGIAYSYLPIELIAEGTRLDVEFFGDRCPATVSREPLFDPASSRLKG